MINIIIDAWNTLLDIIFQLNMNIFMDMQQKHQPRDLSYIILQNMNW